MVGPSYVVSLYLWPMFSQWLSWLVWVSVSLTTFELLEGEAEPFIFEGQHLTGDLAYSRTSEMFVEMNRVELSHLNNL